MEQINQSLKINLAPIIEQFVRAPMLLAAMIMLQVTWLILTWLTGAALHWGKLPLLLVYSVAAGLIALGMPASVVSRLGQLRERLAQNEKLFLGALCTVVLSAGQHPPLMPLVYGLAMHTLGVNLLAPRLVCLALAVTVVLVIYFFWQ